MRYGGWLAAVTAMIATLAAPADAQTTHYNRIPLHQPEHDLRFGMGVELGEGIHRGTEWWGLEGAVTTRVRSWLSVGGERADDVPEQRRVPRGLR